MKFDGVVIWVQDVPSTVDFHQRAGGVPEVEPVARPWGQTLGYLRDLNGCLVELSSPAAW